VDKDQHLEALKILPNLWLNPPMGSCKDPVQTYIRKLADPTRDPAMLGVLITTATHAPQLQFMILAETINAQTSDDTVATLYRKFSSQWRGPLLIEFGTEWCAQVSISRCADLRNKLDGTRLFDPLTRTLLQRIPPHPLYIPMLHAELDREPSLGHQVWGKCIEGTLDFCQALVNDTTNTTVYDSILEHAIDRESINHARWALEHGAQSQIAITSRNIRFMETVNHPIFTSAIQTYHQMRRKKDDAEMVAVIAIASSLLHSQMDDDD
jgi:hypothetical protein